MRFSVATTADLIITEYEGRFRVTDSGVLSIEPDDGNPILLSPAFWLSVEITDAPPRATGGSRIHYA